MYYVCFSTATIVASLILFQGFNTTSGTNTFSLLAGFIVTFLGVHLLNISRSEAEAQGMPPNTEHLQNVMNPRLSTSRLSLDGGWPASPHALRPNGMPAHVGTGSRGSLYGSGGTGTTLFTTYEGEAEGAGVPLSRIGEDDDHEDEGYAEDSDERSRLNPSKRDRPREGGQDSGAVRPGSGERIVR